MSLRELQGVMIEAMFKPEEELQAAAQWVKQQGELSAEQRVGIYRHSVQGILKQSLKSIYPVCEQLVGDAFLDMLADQVLTTQPPETPFLPEYGEAIVKALHEHPALAEMSWIAAVAQLEWARHHAWHGINQVPSDFALLGTLNEEQQLKVCFELPQSMQLIQSDFAIDDVWLAHQPENKIDLERIQIKKQTYLIIWRAGRSLRQNNVTAEQYRFLEMVSQGANLQGLTETFQEQLPVYLSEAISQGWIISFVTSE